MPEIKANTGAVTQVNVFTVKPENQQKLIELLIESANAVRHVPGWKSASIHRGIDGVTVVNYAQSENMEAQSRVFQALTEGGYLERNKLLGEAHPGLYEVVYTIEA
jgi:antibiotic biosynthesis monooxygenase (ABM) superfamily enzyme